MLHLKNLFFSEIQSKGQEEKTAELAHKFSRDIDLQIFFYGVVLNF